MTTATLAEFLAFNDLVAALVRSGMTVHLGLPRQGGAEACEKIAAVVARRVGEGASLPEALQDRAVPEAYRAVAQLAAITGDAEAALSEASRDAQACDHAAQTFRTSMRYPLIVCGLAYVGMVLFCLLLAPNLNGLYESMEVPIGWGMRAVNWLCVSMPYWFVAFPLLLLAIAGFKRWSQSSSNAPSGASVGLAYQQLARFADMLAAYLAAGAALPDALEAAAAVGCDEKLKRFAAEAAAKLRRGDSPSEDNLLAVRLPPLLRWALWRAEPGDRLHALQMAADVYRREAQRRRQRRAVLRPMLACVVIGGGATLLYALALFIPVTQLLQGLAR